jgi:hypothetical protein
VPAQTIRTRVTLTSYHSAAATSHIFGKALERQSSHRLALYFCQKLRFSISPCCQGFIQLRLSLKNHLHILSNAIESPALLVETFLEARQHLQIRADAVLSTITLQINAPTGQDCLPLLMLWDLSNPDGQAFSTSSRNIEALQTFCAHLTHVERQVDDYIASIRALQEVLADFRRVQLTGILIDLEPSLPKRLYENIETTLGLRLVGGREDKLGLSSGSWSRSDTPSTGYES